MDNDKESSNENNDKKEAFIRWQGITIRQLSFVNNLIIGLSTGLLAFQLNLVFSNEAISQIKGGLIFLCSILFVLISLGVGLLTAWNRLKDFRITEKIARNKQKGESGDIEDLRKQSDKLGKKTWILLKLQMAFFGVGALLLLILAIIRLC